MHKIIFAWGLILMLMISLPAFCEIMQGGVVKDGIIGKNKVIDSSTNAPISGAKITLPQENYQTYTDSKGNFAITSDIDGPTVISIEKPGYKPYSMTINKRTLAHGLVLGIDKSTPKDITIDTEMFHLGDNSYSELSANAKDFHVKSIGPYYSKDFEIPDIAPGSRINLVIGSIIGVDTLMAKNLGQNRVSTAYATPPEIYFNGNKIAEIQLNGDGQKIRLPYNLINKDGVNEVTIKTGRNMMQTTHVDYDDIEFMNLSIEINSAIVNNE